MAVRVAISGRGCHGTMVSEFLCMPEASFKKKLFRPFLQVNCWPTSCCLHKQTRKTRVGGDPRKLFIWMTRNKLTSVGQILVHIFSNMKLIFAVFFLVAVGSVSLSF